MGGWGEGVLGAGAWVWVLVGRMERQACCGCGACFEERVWAAGEVVGRRAGSVLCLLLVRGAAVARGGRCGLRVHGRCPAACAQSRDHTH